MKEKIAVFLEDRRNRAYVIIGGVAVILAAGTSGILIGKPDWSPFLTEADHQTVSMERPERKAAESTRASALNMIPGTSVMVSHANTSTLDDVNKWWQYYLGMLMSKESLPETLPEQYGVTSVTYAKVPLTPDSDYYDMYPFGDMLILTVPTEGELELRNFFGETIDGNWMMGVKPSEENPDVSFVYLYSTFLDQEVTQVLDSGGSDFTQKAEANNFKIDRLSPSMLFDMGGYFDQLGGYVQDPKQKKFAQDFASQGLAMEGNAVWVGDTLDGGDTWGGKFLDGNLDAENLDPETLHNVVMNQVQFAPADGPLADPANQVGIADFGMADVQDGVSLTTKDGSFGQVPERESGDPRVAELGDNDAALIISPAELQAVYQGYYPPSELDVINIGFKGDEVTFSFDQE